MTSCLLRIIGYRDLDDELWMKNSARLTANCHVVPAMPILPQGPKSYQVAVCQIKFHPPGPLIHTGCHSSYEEPVYQGKSECRHPDPCNIRARKLGLIFPSTAGTNRQSSKLRLKTPSKPGPRPGSAHDTSQNRFRGAANLRDLTDAPLSHSW
jgi:hypothetical protein